MIYQNYDIHTKEVYGILNEMLRLILNKIWLSFNKQKEKKQSKIKQNKHKIAKPILSLFLFLLA